MFSFIKNSFYALKDACEAPFLLYIDADSYFWIIYDMAASFAPIFASVLVLYHVVKYRTSLMDSVSSFLNADNRRFKDVYVHFQNFCTWFKASSQTSITKINSFVQKFKK